MRMTNTICLAAGLSVAAVLLTGCGSSTQAPEQAADVASEQSETRHTHANIDHDHSGWWCVEHGVPEDECALCDNSLVSTFKEKGDWCDEHNRPDSHCFICHPENFAAFAARYEAKFGEQPPKPTE